MDLKKYLRVGDKIHNVYGDYANVATYTPGTDITIADRTITDDSITVSTIKVVPAYIDDYEQLQSNYAIASHYAVKGQRTLNNVIDQLHNYYVTSAAQYVDAGDVGGSAGSYITLSATNVADIPGAAREKLGLLDVDQDMYFMAGPRFFKLLRANLAGRATTLGDKVIQNGYLGPFDDFNMYQSNNCYFTATLGMAAIPTEGDTVSLASAKLTFNATPSGAGSVDIGTADVSRANLVACIMDTGTAGTTYIQLAPLTRWKLIKAGVTATNNNSVDTMTVTAYGELSTAETLTDTTDAWTAQYVHYIAAAKKAIDIIIQANPSVDIIRDPARLGQNLYVHTLYGGGVWNNNTQAIVDIRVDASAWVTG